VVKKMNSIFLREVNTVTPEGQMIAEEYGITSIPATVINGRIAFIGVPEPRALRNSLLNAVKDEADRYSYFF